jgi:hypothetical protein
LKKEVSLTTFLGDKLQLWNERKELLNDASLSFTSDDSIGSVNILDELSRARRCLEFSLDRYFEDAKTEDKSLHQIVKE